MTRSHIAMLVGSITGIITAGISLHWIPIPKATRIDRAGPMVQDVRTNGFSLVWWQDDQIIREAVLRDPAGHEVRVPAHQSGSRCEARADSLHASTRYEYWLEPAPPWLKTNKLARMVNTAPDPGAPFSFIVFGDSGCGSASQRRLADVMREWPTSLILHTGDLVYDYGAYCEYPGNFFRPYQSLIETTPMYPALGNHDIRTDNGQPLLDVFTLPENGPPGIQPERCYWFDYGNARFIGIDSNLDRDTLLNRVAPWLTETLLSAPGSWKFVFFHHSPIPSGGRPLDVDVHDTLIPAIERGGADMVFNGHNHLYQRTYPMLAGSPVSSNGVIYVTSGAGGNTLSLQNYRDASRLITFNDNKHSFTWINVNGPRLQLKQISEDNNLLDSEIWVK